ncbi:MAG: ribonuclease R [Firmicutes bacterium]|nr:ribonuclease R [Bacillota bacterium]
MELGQIVQGVFQGTMQGFGFVRISDIDEIFIPPDRVHDALPKDVVECIITELPQGDRRAAGEVVKVISHGLNRITGDYIQGGWIVADDPVLRNPIQVVKPEEGEPVHPIKGHKVIARIVGWPENGGMQAVVEEDLGDAYAPTARIRAAICNHELPIDFPEEVLAQTDPLPDVLEITAEEMQYREDLRDLPMVTIDGEDARDLDDAVSLVKTEKGYELGVHIADVSWYVREGTALDDEAYNRGTSVYLTDRVIPMLPRKLSNGLCSLNEGQDRYAMSCIMQLSEDGEILSHRVVESVIKTAHRMTYTDVQHILEGSRLEEDQRSPEQAALMEKYADWVETFCLMAEVAGLRRRIRRKRGAIEFEFPECKILMDAHGYPTEIGLRSHTEATGLIEEFMLAANETVAEEYFWREVPFMYRVHPRPEPDRVMMLGSMLKTLGHSLKGAGNGQMHSRAVQDLLQSLDEDPEEGMISRMILRSMKQAKYESAPGEGHFGLAAPYYCHFTSPIRRYPDLMVHRMIKAVLRGKMDEAYMQEKVAKMDEMAARCSFTERRAEEAERDVEKYMKALYMSDQVRMKTSGVISGVTERGIYVELPDTVEGFIPIEELDDDYYIYDKKQYTLTGKHRKREFRMGQPMDVKVDKVDLNLAIIYFKPLTARIKRVPRRNRIRW